MVPDVVGSSPSSLSEESSPETDFIPEPHMETSKYRIYPINRPGGLLNFWILRVGAYLRWALTFRGRVLIKFSQFSTSVVCIFCKKTVNGNNKTRRCNKARFLQNTLKKTPSSGKSQISTYSFFWVVAGREWALV